MIIFFEENFLCENCGNSFVAVGNLLGKPMTTGQENVIAFDVKVNKSKDGELIDFKIECPVCKIVGNYTHNRKITEHLI